MSILPRLFELYRRRGFTPVAGLNPLFWGGFLEANFTWLLRDGASYTNGLGIAPQEIQFLECLFAGWRPARMLVIGNSFGWSSLALGLLAPEGKVVAIDAGFDQNSLDGIELTNSIAAEAGLRVRAVRGVSPGDVGEIARGQFDGPVDFAFIDGYHGNEQIVLDFDAVRACAAPEAVHLFHDVHNFDLYAGLAQIEQASGLTVRRLMATPSGMAIAYPAARAAVVAPALSVFAPDPAALAVIDKAAWRHAHPARARWRRSLVKRRDKVMTWLGREKPASR